MVIVTIENPTHLATSQDTEARQKPIATFPQIIEEHDRDNPVQFAQYAQRIVNHWSRTQDRYRCTPDYLEGQTEIKSHMRETLIDWLLDVNLRYRHRRETLYLCANIIDRYVYYSIRDKTDVITRSNYQLVGITAYFIASKYEEIYYPDLRSLLNFADNIYREEEVKKMELKMVNTLKYDLSVPTTNKFLMRFLRVG